MPTPEPADSAQPLDELAEFEGVYPKYKRPNPAYELPRTFEELLLDARAHAKRAAKEICLTNEITLRDCLGAMSWKSPNGMCLKELHEFNGCLEKFTVSFTHEAAMCTMASTNNYYVII